MSQVLSLFYLIILIIQNTTDCKSDSELIKFYPTRYVRWENIGTIHTRQNISTKCTVSKLIYQSIKFLFKLQNGTYNLASESDIVTTWDEQFYTKYASIFIPPNLSDNPITDVVCAARKINASGQLDILSYPVNIVESSEPEIQNAEKRIEWVRYNDTQDKLPLFCSAKGFPNPMISWYHGDEVITHRFDTIVNIDKVAESTIYLKKSNLSSSSTFIRCNASNFLGFKLKQFEIRRISEPTVASPEVSSTQSQPSFDKPKNDWILSLMSIALAIMICVFILWILSCLYKNHKNPFMPHKTELKNPEKTLVFQKQIGRGHFGQVSLYVWKTKKGNKTVAVKQLTNREDLYIFHAELKMLQKVGYHENIIQYFGCVTKTKDISNYKIIVEYCENKDLLAFLKNNRSEAAITVSDSSCYDNFAGYEESLTCFKFNLEVTQLIEWCYNIACGMEYLHSKTQLSEITVHRDLAARNVLLDGNLIAKIGDFGLAKTLQKEDDFYKATPGMHLPWLWLPLEALEKSEFSLESDIWSFGITMQEILSLGEQPYMHENYEGRKIKSSEMLIEFLKTGNRMKFPLIANKNPYTDQLYKIMGDCWKENPHSRANFRELKARLNLLRPRSFTCANIRQYETV